MKSCRDRSDFHIPDSESGIPDCFNTSVRITNGHRDCLLSPTVPFRWPHDYARLSSDSGSKGSGTLDATRE